MDVVEITEVLALCTRVFQKTAVSDAGIKEAHTMQSRRRPKPQHLGIVGIWPVKDKVANFSWIGNHAEGKGTQFIDTGRNWC